MADPFSIATGALQVADACVAIVQKLRAARRAYKAIGGDLQNLASDIDALYASCDNAKVVANSLNRNYLLISEADRIELHRVTERLNSTFEDCEDAIRNIHDIYDEIVAGTDMDDPKMRDKIKMAFKKDSRQHPLEEARRRISQLQSLIQSSLGALNIFVTLQSHDSTKLSIEEVSMQFRQLKRQLELGTVSTNPDESMSTQEMDYVQKMTLPAYEMVAKMRKNRHCYLPASVDRLFTGREKLLEELADTFDVSKPAFSQRRFVIFGLSGSGKTQFVCKFAEMVQDRFWGIFRVDASSPANATNSFCEIARCGKVSENEAAAKSWLSTIEWPWLLIIDNADDRRVHLEDYFPPGRNGYILVTTRNPRNYDYGNIGRRYIHFDRLPKPDARNLLLEAAGERRPWRDPAVLHADKISDELFCLPLALVYAGVQIRKRICEWANYLNYYKRVQLRKFATRSYKGQEHLNDDESAIAVYKNLEGLYQTLQASQEQKNTDAIELMHMLAFFHNQNIHLSVLEGAALHPAVEKADAAKAAESTPKLINKVEQSFSSTMKASVDGWIEGMLEAKITQYLFYTKPVLPAVLSSYEDADDFKTRLRTALNVLVEESIINEIDSNGAFSIHPMAHHYFRIKLGSEAKRAVACEMALTALARCVVLEKSVFIGKESEYYQSTHLLPHIQHAMRCRAEIYEKLAQIMQMKKGRFSIFTRPYFGKDEALRLLRFSVVHTQRGQFHTAYRLQAVVRDFVVGMRGMFSPKSISITFLLALTCQQLTRFREAVQLQQKAVVACEYVHGRNHQQTLEYRDILGMFFLFHGRLAESTETHTYTFDEMTKQLGPKHKLTLTAQNRLGVTQQKYFRWQKSYDICSAAMQGLISIEPDGEETLFAKENVAMACIELGEAYHAEALKLMLEVKTEREKKLGKEQPYTLLAILNLSRVHLAMGNPNEAEFLVEPALKIAIRDLGATHQGSLGAKTFYADIRRAQKRYLEAEEMYIANLAEYTDLKRRYGHDHIDRIHVLYHMIEFYEEQGQFERALELCQEMYIGMRDIDPVDGKGLRHPMNEKRIEKEKQLRKAIAMAGQPMPLIEGKNEKAAVPLPPEVDVKAAEASKEDEEVVSPRRTFTFYYDG